MMETTSPANESATNESSTKRETTTKKIYELLKSSYFPSVNSVISDQELEKQPLTKKTTLNKMNAIFTAIKGIGQKQMFHYCILGETFKLLKQRDKVSDKKLDEYLKKIKVSGFGKSTRNFYISLHDYAKKYNKIMRVDISSITISKIIHGWKDLKKMIDNESDFWK